MAQGHVGQRPGNLLYCRKKGAECADAVAVAIGLAVSCDRDHLREHGWGVAQRACTNPGEREKERHSTPQCDLHVPATDGLRRARPNERMSALGPSEEVPVSGTSPKPKRAGKRFVTRTTRRHGAHGSACLWDRWRSADAGASSRSKNRFASLGGDVAVKPVMSHQSGTVKFAFRWISLSLPCIARVALLQDSDGAGLASTGMPCNRTHQAGEPSNA